MLLEEGTCTDTHGAPQTVANELQGLSDASVKIAFAHQKGRCGLDVREDGTNEVDEVRSENVYV